LINATTTAGTAGQTLYDVNSIFGLDFSPKFQYGDYNAATHTYDYVEADAEVTLSADNATVYVHLPLSTALKTKLANTPTSSNHVGSLPEKTFLILYDPYLILEVERKREREPEQLRKSNVSIDVSRIRFESTHVNIVLASRMGRRKNYRFSNV
jgi:hypothetical protein